MNCCFCKTEITDRESHNANEIVTGGRCCGDCNSMIVIPHRLMILAELPFLRSTVRQACNNTLRAHNEDGANDADPS